MIACCTSRLLTTYGSGLGGGDNPSTPELIQGSLAVDFGLLMYVDAIGSISKRTPEHAETLLQSYLTNEKEIVRAVAASVVFDGRKGAWEYVYNERLISPPPSSVRP